MLEFLRKLASPRRPSGELPEAGHSRLPEQADDVWPLRVFEQLVPDFRFALRSLTKSPAFFFLATTGTGLGVAAITSVLSVAGATLFESMPFREPERLVVVSDQLLKLGFARFPVTVANYLDYRAQNRVFEDIAAFEPRAMTVATNDRAERLSGALASSNFLSVMGGSLEQGRWISPEDNHAGRTGVAIVSHAFWQTRLSADPNVLGKVVRIDEVTYTVIGVLEDRFRFRISGEAPQLWLPAILDAPDRYTGNLRLIGRLKPRVTSAEASAHMQVIAAGLKQRYRTGMGPRGEDGGYAVAVTPLREELYGSVRATLYALGAASGILLILGLTNTAILWLGRASARRREAAVRLALGASRGRVARQLIMEALVPSLAGGILALGLTLLALDTLQSSRLAEFSTVDQFRVDYRVFSFVMLLSVVAGVLFGTLPMRPMFGAGAEGQALGCDRAGIGDRREGRARSWLVMLQAGFACALLPPALLLIQSLMALERVNPGFRRTELFTALVTLPASKYGTLAQIEEYYRRLQRDLIEWRGAGRATLASQLPLTFGTGGDPFSIEGRAYNASGAVPQFAHLLRTGADYFQAMGIPIRAGRGFEERDFSNSADVAIVNETLAKAFWPREPAVGKRILMGAPRPGAKWMEIVGVAGDVHTAQLSHAPLPQIYRPFTQAPTRTMALIVSGRELGGRIAAGLERIARAADPNVPLYEMRTMEQRVSASLDRPRFRTQLFAAYGLLAFALAAFGIYSLSFYSAVRRRREFALRTALGATPRRLLLAALGGTMRPAALGACGGLTLAYVLARGVGAFLYETNISAAGVYVIAGCMTLAAAALATGIGGSSALDADAAELLRGE